MSVDVLDNTFVSMQLSVGEEAERHSTAEAGLAGTCLHN